MAAPINCNNDRMMIQEGLRPPPFIINKEVFRKSLFEKNQLKVLKFKKKYAPVRKTGILKKIRLAVHVRNDKGINNFKNTYSFILNNKDVDNYLMRFKDQIIKYNISNVY